VLGGGFIQSAAAKDVAATVVAAGRRPLVEAIRG